MAYPTRATNASLAAWVSMQRRRYNGTASPPLREEQIAALEALPGWRWSITQAIEETWQEIQDWTEQAGRRPHLNKDDKEETRIYRQLENVRSERAFPDEMASFDLRYPPSRIARNTPLWWTTRVFKYGDITPVARKGEGSWYNNIALVARDLCQGGKMPKDQQARCRKEYPKLWKWLNGTRRTKFKLNSPEWWDRVFSKGDLTPDKSVDREWYINSYERARKLYHAGDMPQFQQKRCGTQFPKLWAWLIVPVQSRYKRNSPEWWQQIIYVNGNVTPSSPGRGNSAWQGQCFRARDLYRGGEMSKAEQLRCRRDYPVLWEWLTLQPGIRA